MDATTHLDPVTPTTSWPTPPPPPPQASIFTGPFGLRAGWSLLLYFVFLGVIGFGMYEIGHQVAVHKHHVAELAAKAAGKPAPPPLGAKPSRPPSNEPGPISNIIINEAIIFAGLFLLSWLMAAIERRKLSAFGLGGIRPVRRFLIGSAFGLVAQSILIAILYFDHLLVFDARLQHGLAILKWGIIELFAYLLVGLVEEYLFRGYLQFTLTRGLVGLGKLISEQNARSIAFWIAAVLTSVLFYFAHTGNPGETRIGLFQVFLAGILLLVCLWRTGSLWLAIGFHMTWDWAQSFLYGVPDSGGLDRARLFATHALGNPRLSGGTDGPEGSLFGIPILLLAIVAIFFLSPSPQPPLETKPQLATPEPIESLPPSLAA
jgi:membrane protease YdiL (CAAX protease family)